MKIGFHFAFALLTLFITQRIEANFMKKLKQRGKDIYNKKFGKDKTWHFLGHDLSEYPGTNEKYREMNKRKWDEYYECLRKREDDLGEKLSPTPEAIQLIEGASISLECKLCQSPENLEEVDSVDWFFAGKDDDDLTPIDFTEHIFISPDDKSLQLYNMQIEQTGQYLCTLGETLTSPYFITIIRSFKSNIREVHPSRAPKGPYPTPDEKVVGRGLILKTKWELWTSCSTCGKVGKRRKFGYCIVTKENTGNQMGAKAEIKRESDSEMELFEIFDGGIPCQSHILPQDIKSLPEVINRKDEMMVGFCKIACPEDKIFEVRDEKGNVIERANNSAGIYSMLQGVPPQEPTVERRLQYGVKGKEIILTCPGNTNTDAPITWQIGFQLLVPELISVESQGRIFISVTDRIHIGSAKIADTNIYSCWQHNELAGVIRLIVEKKVEMNFNHHIMLLGLVLILSTFLYVFTNAFLGRKYAAIPS